MEGERGRGRRKEDRREERNGEEGRAKKEGAGLCGLDHVKTSCSLW